MTENSASDVGRARIDAYLDSVEQAMLTAHAPRGDRTQVLADLESQIADMLAQEPQPLTEERVQAVIGKLEPPSHFAAMYGSGMNGNGKQPHVESPRPDVKSLLERIRWSRVALAGLLVPFVGTFLEVLIAATGGRANGAILVLSILAGLLLTPAALWMAYRQLREQPGRFPDRNFVVSMIIGFAVVGPAFVMIVLTEWTYTLVFVPFGIVGYVWLHYLLVKRLRRYLGGALATQGSNAENGNDGQREVSSPMSSAAWVAM